MRHGCPLLQGFRFRIIQRALPYKHRGERKTQQQDQRSQNKISHAPSAAIDQGLRHRRRIMAPVPTPAITSASAKPRRESNQVETARE